MQPGGYPLKLFKNKLGDQYKCLKCKLVLQNPVRCLSCEEEYCKACYTYLNTNNRQCIYENCKPSHRNIKTTESLKTKRLLDEEECFCSNKENGCNWEGKLKMLDNHLNLHNSMEYRQAECQYVKKPCKYCKSEYCRKDVDEHEKQECKYRPQECELCGHKSTFLDITEHHPTTCLQRPIPCSLNCKMEIKRADMKLHIEEYCPNAEVECDIDGCNVKMARKDLQMHKQNDAAKHVEILCKEVKLLKQEKEQEKEQKRINRAKVKVLPVTFTVNNFIQLKHASDSWHSDLLYTKKDGHALCVIVHPHGVSASHVLGDVSVFVYVTKGKYDDNVEWPCRKNIIVELLDQQGQNHFSRTVRVSGINATSNQRYGWRSFIAAKRLEPQYLQNNCLKFRLSLGD